MISTIAWATDRSPSAVNALDWAKELARQVDAKLLIVYVEESVIGRSGLLIEPDESALPTLNRMARHLQGDGIDATVSVARAPAGRIADTIVELVDKAGADVIVVGNRGHGPIAGFFLGSVAARLLQIAPCPVLMVPARQNREGNGGDHTATDAHPFDVFQSTDFPATGATLVELASQRQVPEHLVTDLQRLTPGKVFHNRYEVWFDCGRQPR